MIGIYFNHLSANEM